MRHRHDNDGMFMQVYFGKLVSRHGHRHEECDIDHLA